MSKKNQNNVKQPEVKSVEKTEVAPSMQVPLSDESSVTKNPENQKVDELKEAVIPENDAELDAEVKELEDANAVVNSEVKPESQAEEVESEDDIPSEAELPEHFSKKTKKSVRRAMRLAKRDEERRKLEGVEVELEFDFDAVVDGKVVYPKGKHKVPVIRNAHNFWLARGAKLVKAE